jgi:hypothetical protein
VSTCIAAGGGASGAVHSQGGLEMVKKLDLALILTLLWLFLHRIVLRCYKVFLGAG